MSIFVNFMGVRWDVGFMDPEFLSSVNLINGSMRQVLGEIAGLLRGLSLRLYCRKIKKIEQ